MNISKSFQEVASRCEDAFSNNDLQALRLAVEDLESYLASTPAAPLEELAVAAGLLIDAGAALGLRTAVEQGQLIFVQNWDTLLPVYGAAQLNYNVGNAHKALYDIERTQVGWQFNIASADFILKAKAGYWRALSETQPGKITPKLLTNLGNALDASGRVIDALHYYDLQRPAPSDPIAVT